MKCNLNVHTGFSASRLEAITEKIRADIDAGLIPGAVMLIARADTVVYEKALGLQVPQTAAPMALDSIFRIYSMTKPLVSVAIMTLVEEGRMLLSDPIDKYLPEFRRMKVGVEITGPDGVRSLHLTDARQPITVQDLLRHTSGLTYGIFGESLVKSEYLKAGVGTVKASSAEFIERIAGLPLAYQPGTTWEYSHSTDVLGVLLERICGAPLDAVLAERILEPLAMHETGFQVRAEHAHRIAEPFAIDPVTRNAVKLLDPLRRPTFLSGGGGMMSTVYDYLRFARMLLNEGELDGKRILSRATLRYMTSDHLGQMPEARAGASFLPGPGYGFGLGFGVRISPGGAFIPGSVGDYTWSGLAGTYFWIDPVEKMLAIFLMQAPEQRNHYRQLFRNLVYGALN
ncbi:MAG TPA: serine hydrolase domain-containing protein [Noviherbaspirillum sp.]|jgi:CubicO group peptidase (beta-lactamase class C family)|uniref:serine hydrolase domain-containing protein n=1 Tax=Noviherbaspirillum sp. TaxID=1926288 RepID=UPI002DDD8000|nr:serine hydrolase domain-containing protein [Noviherbaspirillum sp.]HEV2609146.1 serine hydrolase domain-containing protein [Noviherbaspirillum sp.]